MPSEPEMNNDPVSDKLARFTPDASGLDRDALLFEAGRASAGRRRLWPVAVGLLALSQTVTLLFFLNRGAGPAAPVVVVAPHVEPAHVGARPPSFEEPEAPAAWTFRRAAMTGDIDDLPPPRPGGDETVPNSVMTVRSISAVLPVN